MKLQPASQDIYNKKYQLADRDGTLVDVDVDSTYTRVASALAANEIEKEYWTEKFKYAMDNGATPAGRIISNAGASKYKPSTSLINCTVSASIEDSMPGILEGVKQAGITLAAGCGIGYEFSVLRPNGALVGGVGANTSGSLSFMDIYDKMCFTVSSAGGRRGAQMATFDISHPDALAFIKAKREDGRFRQFNMSLLITKDFMEAVKGDKDWNFVFPVHKKEYHEGDAYVWKKPNYPVSEADITRNSAGLVAHKIFGTMKAKDLWDVVMQSTYDFAEPGFILIDKVNEMNNNWFCEKIRATNPCVSGDTLVTTPSGQKQMKELVDDYNAAGSAEVLSMNVATGDIEIQPVSFADMTRKDAVVIEIVLDDGKTLVLTPDHKVYTSNRGYVEAANLTNNDDIVVL
jgi:ribonucleoside-diphosphate reductase alpha chain